MPAYPVYVDPIGYANMGQPSPNVGGIPFGIHRTTVNPQGPMQNPLNPQQQVQRWFTLQDDIDFENATTATAPAQVVTITDQLASTFDWTTFHLTEIAFGETLLTIPASSSTTGRRPVSSAKTIIPEASGTPSSRWSAGRGANRPARSRTTPSCSSWSR